MFELNTGDVSEVLEEIDDNYFDCCFCDPPYGLKFMGKQWGHGVPSKEVWEKVLRVLKPGGMLLAFGGTRTYHRLTCAIEDAGFEIRDCLMWVYGSGFPKSHNISKAIDKKMGKEREIVKTIKKVQSYGHNGNNCYDSDKDRDGSMKITIPTTPEAKQWDGYGTALKPAYEPIILAMKPLDGTFVNNALKHGVAGINVDGCRIPLDGSENLKAVQNGNIYGGNEIYGKAEQRQITATYKPQGRWPANILHDGSDEVLDLFPQTKSGALKPYKENHQNVSSYQMNRNKTFIQEANVGSAARYFYCAKAGKKERNAGCTLIEEKVTQHDGRQIEIENPHQQNKSSISHNNHPTVKPLTLTEYLAKLILPPKRENDERKLLVPFSGSGSEIIGGLKAGWDFVCGIEKEEEYNKIAEARLEHHSKLLETNDPQ